MQTLLTSAVLAGIVMLKKNNVLIVFLIGGLGNQMFQYAFGKIIARKTNMELKLDISAYKHYKLHDGFVLNKYFKNQTFLIADNKTIIKIGGIFAFLNNSLIDKFLGFYWKYSLDHKIIYEPNFNYWHNIFQITDSKYLKGYWQSFKYFNDNEEFVKSLFEFPREFEEKFLGFLSKLKSFNTIAVHVRRGDFSENDFHELLPLEYYSNAFQYAHDHVSNPLFIIFSNDIEWCKINIFHKNSRFIFIDKSRTQSAFEDLFLMTKCDNHIISNSTFSWWGAWLATGENGLVIAPKKWFNKTLNISTSDLIPDSWIKI